MIAEKLKGSLNAPVLITSKCVTGSLWQSFRHNSVILIGSDSCPSTVKVRGTRFMWKSERECFSQRESENPVTDRSVRLALFRINTSAQ